MMYVKFNELVKQLKTQLTFEDYNLTKKQSKFHIDDIIEYFRQKHLVFKANLFTLSENVLSNHLKNLVNKNEYIKWIPLSESTYEINNKNEYSGCLILDLCPFFSIENVSNEINYPKFLLKDDKIIVRKMDYKTKSLVKLDLVSMGLPYEASITIPDNKFVVCNYLNNELVEESWGLTKKYSDCSLQTISGLHNRVKAYAEQNILFTSTGNTTMYVLHSPSIKQLIISQFDLNDPYDYNDKKFKRLYKYIKDNSFENLGQVSNSMWRTTMCHESVWKKYEMGCSNLSVELNVDKPTQVKMTSYCRVETKKPKHGFLKGLDFFDFKIIILDYGN